MASLRALLGPVAVGAADEGIARRAAFKARLSTLKRYLDKIAEFDGYDRKGYRIRQGENESRRRELAIPSRTTAEQMDEINRARTYAESLGTNWR